MLNVKRAAQLEESLISMHDKLSSTIKALSKAKALDEQYWGAISIWNSNIYSVAEQAAIANEPGLNKICLIIICQLNKLSDASAKPIISYCIKLINWTTDALTYLQNTADFNQVKVLLSPIPTDDWKDITLEFKQTQNINLQTPGNATNTSTTLSQEIFTSNFTNITVSVPADIVEFPPIDFVEKSIVSDHESTIISATLDPIVKREGSIESTPDSSHSLSLIIESAIESLTQELSDESNQSDSRSEILFEYCLCSVADVGFSSELFHFTFISALCIEMEQYLTTQAGDNAALSRHETEQCKQWLTTLLVFLEDSKDSKQAKTLIAFIDDKQQANAVFEIFNVAGSSGSNINLQLQDSELMNTHEFNTDPALPADLTPSEDIANTNTLKLDSEQAVDSENEVSAILYILKEELADLAQEMSELIITITNQKNQTELQLEAYKAYQLLIARLAETCDTLGLLGLQKMCSFVEHNLTLTLTANDLQKQSVQYLFMSWPEQVQSYLESPDNDNKCLALIECMQQKNWLKPLDDIQARQILLDLSQQLALPEQIDSEQSRQSDATADDVTLNISPDIVPGLIDAFFMESPKFASDLSRCIGQIGAGENLPDNISAAQRFAHTLKGSANLIGVKGVANITHHMEDILEYLLTHQDDFPLTLITTLQEAADCVETMLDSLQGKDDIPEDAQRILQDILDWANSIDTGDLDEFARRLSVPTFKTDSANSSEPQHKKNTDNAIKPHLAAEETINVPTRIIDNMFRMVGELSIMASQVNTGLEQLRTHSMEVKGQEQRVHQHRIELEDMVDIRRFSASQRHSHNNATHSHDFDSLEMDQYDELHGSIHGFIETVVDSNEMTHMIYSQIAKLEDLLVSQQRVNNELQRVVMHARMVPVNSIVARLQRTVRQTCRQTNKSVTLNIIGDEILLDGEVLNTMVAPIMHLLRNAVDHGIETAAARKLSGKEPIGNITLEFSRVGNNVVVRCSDDGKGLNYDRIREIAIQNDFVSKDEISKKHELARLILVSGFTTRDTVTQISGRGVGLEVVNSTIQAQGGSMNIGDNSPCGCIVSLRIPISLVTSHSILVKNGDELFAVPSNTLIRIIPSGGGKFRSLTGKITFHHDDKAYDVITLATLLGTSGSVNPEHLYENPAILLIKINHVVTAVAVEQVVSSTSLVIKNLGPYVPTLPGISGVSIMGDGKIVSIIDLKELIEKPRSIIPESLLGNEGEIDIEKSKTPTVLVVDDSLSMRKSLSQLVGDAGYQVETARDGVEAMNIIRKHPPTLVLSDMEMPRMTGLELTSQIRSNTEFNNLPVIMITSRSAKKHRVQAQRAGVSEYITKPFSEDNLLEVVTSIIVAQQASKSATVIPVRCR